MVQIELPLPPSAALSAPVFWAKNVALSTNESRSEDFMCVCVCVNSRCTQATASDARTCLLCDRPGGENFCSQCKAHIHTGCTPRVPGRRGAHSEWTCPLCTTQGPQVRGGAQWRVSMRCALWSMGLTALTWMSMDERSPGTPRATARCACWALRPGTPPPPLLTGCLK